MPLSVTKHSGAIFIKINKNFAHTRKIGNVGDGVLDVPKNSYYSGDYHPLNQGTPSLAGRPLSKNSPPDCFLIHPLRSALFYFVALKAESDDQRRCLWTPPKEHSPFGIPYIGSAYLLRCKRCTNIIFDIIKRVCERQRGKRSSWLSSKF